MRFFGKQPHTEMSVPERVEYFTEVDDKMTDINCARFADSRQKALRLIIWQVQLKPVGYIYTQELVIKVVVIFHSKGHIVLFHYESRSHDCVR